MSANHGGRYREPQSRPPMCNCFQSRVQGPMVSSSCPACAIERCVDQGVPPESATIQDMMRYLEALHIEASQTRADSLQNQEWLISRDMEELDDMQIDEVNQRMRALQKSMDEAQQLIMRIRRNTSLLCQGGLLLERSTQSSPSRHQQVLQLMQENQSEMLKLQQQQSQFHELIIQKDLRTLRLITAAAQRGRQMCTIL